MWIKDTQWMNITLDNYCGTKSSILLFRLNLLDDYSFRTSFNKKYNISENKRSESSRMTDCIVANLASGIRKSSQDYDEPVMKKISLSFFGVAQEGAIEQF